MISLLVLATVATYGNGIVNGFVWDDYDVVVNNPANGDLSNIAQVFLTADSTVGANQKTYYRPLNRLTYMMDFRLFGLRPAVYHIENILIHFCAVILLYLLAHMLSADTATAFMAALIFVVHPVNAEAVNFISARNTLLSTLFVLSALIAYIRADTTGGKKTYYSLSALFFFMGLLCKEPAVALLAILFLYELSNFPSCRARIKEKIFPVVLFSMTTALYLFLRVNALSTIAGGHDLGGLWERLSKNVYIIPRYALVVLFPVRLNAFYAVPDNFLAEGVWSFFFWVAMAGVAIYFMKKSGTTRFGLFWLAVNALPISNIVPIPSAPMAERYLYQPAIGFWLIAADQCRAWYLGSAHKKTLTAAGVALVFCLMMITVNRNLVWRDGVSLFSSMAGTNDNSALAHYNLGLAYKEKHDIQGALEEWKKTAAINPRYHNVYSRLGESYLMINSPEQAEYYYAMEVQVNPGDAIALYNLALLEEKLGKPKEALKYYEMFFQLQPREYLHLIPKIRADIDRLREHQ